MSNRKLSVILLSIGINLASISLLRVTAAAPQIYYIDCNEGSDAHVGTSPEQAWQTLGKGSQVLLEAGDQLLLKRGCVWDGTLTLSNSGTSSQSIYVGAYGTGEYPTIQSDQSDVHPVVISGNYHVIENLSTVGIAPARDANCDNTAVGLIDGFLFEDTSSHNILRNSKATGLSSGVKIGRNANNNLIIGNVFVDNNMMSILSPTSLNNNDDTGAFGVEVAGDANEIAYNTISGGDACSYDYGRDGSAVEIYGGHHNSVHHNLAHNNNTFTELGRSGTSDNTFANNVVTSTLQQSFFLITRGPNDTFGPVLRTKAYNNTVYLTGSQSLAVGCYAGCGTDILTLKNNILWAEHIVGYSDHPFDESYNLMWRSDGRPEIYFGSQGIQAHSRQANPAFVDIALGDFHLQAASPAVDMGTAESINAGYAVDFDGKLVPIGSAIDVGAYEFVPSLVMPPERAETRICAWAPGAWYLRNIARSGEPDYHVGIAAGRGLEWRWC